MRRGSVVLAAVLLSACSSSNVPGVPPVSPAISQPAGERVTSGKNPNVVFLVRVPAPRPAVRRARFTSPSTQSMRVLLNGTSLGVANITAGSATCKAVSEGRVCRVAVHAPAGTNVFTLTGYDALAGAGNVLESGQLTVKTGTAKKVGVSLTGTVARLDIALENPYLPAGRAAAIPLDVEAFDADGNAIVGAYDVPIALSDIDPTAGTKLSTASISDSSLRARLLYTGAPLSSALLQARAAGIATASATFAPTPSIVESRPVPNFTIGGQVEFSGLSDICVAPDGTVWGVNGSSGGVTTFANGTFTSYPQPNGEGPISIVAGYHDDFWFVNLDNGTIGRVTAAGHFTQYTIPVAKRKFSQPTGIARGPNGLMWFLDQGIDAIGTISESGAIVEYPLPRSSAPESLVQGYDGNLWVTDQGSNAIVVISPAGKIVARHAIRTPQAQPWGITRGPNGSIWFAEFGGNRVGRVASDGTVADFPLPSAFAGPLEITSGPDNHMWFTETGGSIGIPGKIAYITLDGSYVREIPLLDLAHSHGLAFDAKGNLWFSSFQGPFSSLNRLVY
jgi:virginiamycin B lyase